MTTPSMSSWFGFLPRSWGLRLLAAALLLAAVPAMAQSVLLAGTMGTKALLIIDGGSPVTLAIGQTRDGVTVLSTAGDEAVVEVAGVRRTLRVGDTPASVGASGRKGGSSKIVMNIDPSGLFLSPGSINGKSVDFIVDTGATMVGMNVAEAVRAGLNYRNGQSVLMQTANGVSKGWVVKLASVRVGDVELHGVDATVSELGTPYVLLGNSFLSHFQMNRDQNQMTLERR